MNFGGRDGATPRRSVLDRLLPLHFVVDAKGRIAHAGPTLRKLRPAVDLVGTAVDSVFELAWRGTPTEGKTNWPADGGVLRVRFRDGDGPVLRGVAVPLDDGGGAIVHLSFGVAIRDAIRRYDLNSTDFAATDPTVEMLFLIEANRAAMSEWRNLAERLRGAQSAAEEQARTDPLTGATNRRGLELAAGRAWRPGCPAAVLAIDLDYFKDINDRLGHAAGDAVLRAVADVLNEETRESDIVARTGGDEFIVVMPDCRGPDQVRSASDRILNRLKRLSPDINGGVSVSASIGAAIAAKGAEFDLEALIAEADQALYASKADGRGRATVPTSFGKGSASRGMI